MTDTRIINCWSPHESYLHADLLFESSRSSEGSALLSNLDAISIYVINRRWRKWYIWWTSLVPRLDTTGHYFGLDASWMVVKLHASPLSRPQTEGWVIQHQEGSPSNVAHQTACGLQLCVCVHVWEIFTNEGTKANDTNACRCFCMNMHGFQYQCTQITGL